GCGQPRPRYPRRNTANACCVHKEPCRSLACNTLPRKLRRRRPSGTLILGALLDDRLVIPAWSPCRFGVNLFQRIHLAAKAWHHFGDAAMPRKAPTVREGTMRNGSGIFETTH